MTIVDRKATTPGAVLDAARELGPTIAGRAAEIEAARRLPADLLEELIGAGAFRLLLSSSYGGIGADLAGAMAVFEAMATADASTGWTVMIGAGSWVDRAGLPRTTFDELYADGPDAIGPDQLGQRPDGADGIGVSAHRRVHLTPRPMHRFCPSARRTTTARALRTSIDWHGTERPPTAHRANEPIRARRAMLRFV